MIRRSISALFLATIFIMADAVPFRVAAASGISPLGQVASPNLKNCPPDQLDCDQIPTNNPPVVSWSVVPVNGSAFLPSDSFPAGAYASDPDGTIAKVQFTVDNVIKGTATAPPYQVTIPVGAPGVHTLQASAFDNQGRTASTSGVSYVVRNSVIAGNVDGIQSNSVVGWACSTYATQSINVDVYVGGPAGTGTMLGRFPANQASESGVATACSVASGSFRFNIPLTATQRIQYGGQKLYVHGISPFGATNSLLGQSGTYAVPLYVRNGQFVSQTVPAQMVAGTAQSVTIQMKNTGDYTWTAGTNFRLGIRNPADSTWGTTRAYLSSDVAPGQTANFTFSVTAPATAGTYNFQWQMLQENVVWFGDISPNVSVTVRAPIRNAQFLSQTVSSSMQVKGTQTITIQMKNTGDFVWSSSAGYSLGSQNPGNNGTWGLARVSLQGDVAPGQVAILSFPITAPTSSGSYNFQWQMLQENVAWFGDSTSNVAISVTAPAPVIADTASIEYDELGRVLNRRDSAGHVKTSYQYDDNGNLLRVTDGLNQTTQMSYDALDRVTSVTDGLGRVSTFAYDAGNRLVRATDAAGATTAYAYDGFGLLWQVTSADSGTTSYIFDATGRLTGMLRANGVQTTYGYDSINRITSISAGGQTSQAAYDSCTNGIGRLCSVTDASGSTSYAYTPEGEIAGRGFSVGGSVYSLGFSYDGMGRLSNVVYPDGNKATYSYSNGLLSGITTTVGGVLSSAAGSLSYRGGDRKLASWTSNNGLVNTLSYDSDGRLTAIRVPGVQDLSLTYDAADRISAVVNGIDPSISQTYGYDAANRLVSSTAASTSESFGYDGNGNRISHSVDADVTANVMSPASNRYTTVGGQAVGYDANGNTASLGGVPLYHFDAFNRLDQASGTSYFVNGEGQRLRKSGSAGVTYFAPSPGGLMMAESSGSGWIDYVWFRDRPIARIEGGQIYSIHSDQTARPISVTSASGGLVWSARNFAFDRQIVLNGISLNLGFPGQYFDEETQLWNNGFRDYDARLGRYIEADPAGLEGGMNSYAYALGDPVSYVDRLGLAPGNCYATLDIAAANAIGDIDPKSIQEDREYAGRLYRTANGWYSYTAAHPGRQHFVDPGAPVPGDVGNYHTHGATTGDGDEHFSDSDLTSRGPGETNYLGTPTNRILKDTGSTVKEVSTRPSSGDTDACTCARTNSFLNELWNNIW